MERWDGWTKCDSPCLEGLIAGPESALEEAANLPQVQVLAFNGSYHGDTLGTMDMQAPSVFTGPLQTPWYKPRGLFMEPPTLQLVKGGDVHIHSLFYTTQRMTVCS